MSKLTRAGQYDVRDGSRSYAQIVGVFGSLALPGIVLLFTVQEPENSRTQLVILAIALLVVGMMSSLVGAFGLAAVGAEQELTANVIPASLFYGIPVSIAIGSMLGAFEVLAAIYLPETQRCSP